MIKKACSAEPTSVIQTLTKQPVMEARLRLLPQPTAGTVQYRVRVGNKLFEGTNTRHLIRLAVQARRAQIRPGQIGKPPLP